MTSTPIADAMNALAQQSEREAQVHEAIIKRATERLQQRMQQAHHDALVQMAVAEFATGACTLH